MNPWQSLRREIEGAIRSFRYDLSAKQSKRTMRRDTVLLQPAWRPATKGRKHIYAVAAAVLLPVAGASGYFAVTSGLDALLPGDGAPNGLPATSAGDRSPSPSPQSPAGVRPTGEIGPQRGRPGPRTSPTFSAPVPTPAPTCQCTPPPPPPTPSASPTPTSVPSSTPTMTPMPTPAPTRSAWQDGSPSPRLTSRLRS